MCGTGWTISQEFIPKPLHFLVKCISAYLTAERTAFSRFRSQAQSCEQGAVARDQSQLAD